MSAAPTHSERDRIGAALSAHLARQRAARILDEQRSERAAIRAAGADARAHTRAASVTALAGAERQPDPAVLIAKRRDEYKRALSYPMLPAEVLAAARDAVASCGLRADTDESAAEVVGLLVLHVMRMHGTQPLRCKVGREWLRTNARRMYDRESARRERATGLKASAQLHAQWAAEDAEADSERDSSGPDAVWYMAANQPAPKQQEQPDAAALAERLQLTPKQADALVFSLESAQRVTAAMSGAERKRTADALSQLRKRFPTVDALRWALRPLRACAAAIERCQRIAARRWQPSGPQRPGPQHLPARMQRPLERPAAQPAQRGCYPAAVALSNGPRWHGLTIASDPQQPARLPESLAVSGPRPHRAAAGLPAGGVGAAREPDLVMRGDGAMLRRAHRDAQRAAAQQPTAARAALAFIAAAERHSVIGGND